MRWKANTYSFLLKGIYWQTQVSGLTPFAYNALKGKAIPSKAWLMYSKCFALTLSSLSLLHLIFYSEPSKVKGKLNIFYLVKAFDICTNGLKAIVVYLIQIYNRNKLIDTVNLAIKIRKNLLYLSPHDIFFDKSFCNHFRRVSFIMLIQSLLFSFYIGESWERIVATNAYFNFILINYFHLSISIIIVKMYYHTGMMIGIRLYEIVNDRISKILKNVVEHEIRKSVKCDSLTGSDQYIDHLMLMFVKTTHLIKSVNMLFSTQIMFVVIGCFMFILSSVSITKKIVTFWINDFLQLYYIFFELLNYFRVREAQGLYLIIHITRITYYVLEIYNICVISDAATKEVIY